MQNSHLKWSNQHTHQEDRTDQALSIWDDDDANNNKE
jgi:hypothetical protein